jgi:hypothetical protein
VREEGGGGGGGRESCISSFQVNFPEVSYKEVLTALMFCQKRQLMDCSLT